jgi:hypothetical protein
VDAGVTVDTGSINREIIRPGGVGTGTGTSGSSGWIGGISPSGLPACTKANQANCCYAEGAGFSGLPKCSWRRLNAGESVTITAAYTRRTNEEKALPTALTLTSVSPAKFETYKECENMPHGFLLSGPGLKEEQNVGNIGHYEIRVDGTWAGGGGGGQHGFSATRNTAPGVTRDGPPPSPTYTLHSGICDSLAKVEKRSYVGLIQEILFTLDGIEYETHFDKLPNGSDTAYFIVIEKAFPNAP